MMSITENNFWNTLQSWFRKFVKIETFLTVLSSVRCFVMIERFTVNTCVLWCLVLQRFLLQTVVHGFSKKSQKQFGSVNLGSCKRAPRTAGRSHMCSKTGSQYHPIHKNGYQYLIGRILTTVSPPKVPKSNIICLRDSCRTIFIFHAPRNRQTDSKNDFDNKLLLEMFG